MYLYSGLQRSKITSKIRDSNLFKTVIKTFWIWGEKIISQMIEIHCILLHATKQVSSQCVSFDFSIMTFIIYIIYNYYIYFIFQSFRIARCHLHLPCFPAWTSLTFFLTPHFLSIQMQNLPLFGIVCLVMFKFFLTFLYF